MSKQKKITEIKTGFDKLRKGDRAYITIDGKLNLVKMGPDLYVCDPTGDPETCLLTNKIDDADFDIIEKAAGHISQELADVKKYLDEKREEEINPFIPGMPDLPDPTKPEPEANPFIPGTPDLDPTKKKKDEGEGEINPFIPD